MTQFGIVAEPVPGHTAAIAHRAEQLGFDVVLCPDTQNVSADPYVQLGLIAAATERVLLGTGVTNPVTRAAAVTASAVASLQIESGGRAICGLGRGDSSAAHIGQRPASNDDLRSYATAVRTYLRGETVPLDGSGSRLRWLDPAAVPPAPIDIAATGPKTIELAADVADRVSLAVGAAPERIRWALDILGKRLEANGRGRAAVQIGAYLNVVADPDPARARSLAKLGTALVAHFPGIRGATLEHLPPRLLAIAKQMRAGYDMARHARDDASHIDLVDEAFVEWYAVAGTPSTCIDRLRELLALGIEHVYAIGGSPVSGPAPARLTALLDVYEVLAREVLPALRVSPSPPTS